MDVIDVHLRLTADTPDSMNFADTYAGLENIWYKFESDAHGNINLSANADGFEHLARYFLKMARGRKSDGYHAHHALEFGADQYAEGKELTIGFVADPGLSVERRPSPPGAIIADPEALERLLDEMRRRANPTDSNPSGE